VKAIVVEEIRKRYAGDVVALDGLSFSVEEGAIFGLLGPNGAGKSTCVRILTTLSRADAGRAEVAGIDVAGDPAAVRRAVGYVAQGSGVDIWATGRENLDLIGRFHHMRSAERRERCARLLDRFGLTEAADRPVKGYSGGMRRRLDVAMGLVHRPQVLFLDEPTTGLDPEHRAAMWEEVSGLAGDEGLTILLTTHYLEEADRLAARLAILDRGRVVASGSPEQLKAELAGDAVTVRVADPEAAASVLGGLDDVHEVVRLDGDVRARVAHGASAVPAILRALEAAGLAPDAVTVTRPSLDDVYLKHAGRSFAEADA
jgi:ABC-2 type transport system ATP-binding protein